MKLLLILSHAPYKGDDVLWNALRMADTALSEGHAVRIFVMNDAVDITRSGSAPAGSEFDLGKMLLETEKRGAEILLCTTCIQRCGIQKGDLINPKWPGGMKDLVRWTDECDKVVTF